MLPRLSLLGKRLSQIAAAEVKKSGFAAAAQPPRRMTSSAVQPSPIERSVVNATGGPLTSNDIEDLVKRGAHSLRELEVIAQSRGLEADYLKRLRENYGKLEMGVDGVLTPCFDQHGKIHPALVRSEIQSCITREQALLHQATAPALLKEVENVALRNDLVLKTGTKAQVCLFSPEKKGDSDDLQKFLDGLPSYSGIHLQRCHDRNAASDDKWHAGEIHKDYCKAAASPLERVIVVRTLIEGKSEIVGASRVVFYDADRGTGYRMAVDERFRNQGVAVAMKVAQLRLAQAVGATRFVANGAEGVHRQAAQELGLVFIKGGSDAEVGYVDLGPG